MHVFFDLRTVELLTTATRIYLVALVDSFLPALEEKDRVTVLLAKDRPLPLPPIEHHAVSYKETIHSGRGAAGTAELSALVHTLKPDVYWSADPLIRPPASPRGRKVRTVFAIEELRHFITPGRFNWTERLHWRFVARPRLLGADALVCPSHALEVRLIVHLGMRSRRRTNIIRNGVHPVFRHHSPEEILEARRRWLVPQRYVLIVGHSDDRVSLATPLEALARNEEVSSVTCVIIGDAGLPTALREIVRDCHLEGMVRFLELETLPPNDLSALYSGAVVTFDPSQGTDYRPTVLQSMACGTPVICPANAVNEELFGNAVMRVHPTDPTEWSKAFVALTLSSALRERLIARGDACAAERTWTATAKASFALARTLCIKKN